MTEPFFFLILSAVVILQRLKVMRSVQLTDISQKLNVCNKTLRLALKYVESCHLSLLVQKFAKFDSPQKTARTR